MFHWCKIMSFWAAICMLLVAASYSYVCGVMFMNGTIESYTGVVAT